MFAIIIIDFNCNWIDSCIPDKYLEVEKNISKIYDSTNQFLPFESSCRDAWKNYACARAFPRCTISNNGTSDIYTPYEICYSVCKQYAYNVCKL